MSKIFDVDNPVWSTLAKLLDLVILNVLFIVCCIPVITIVPSITALYYTAMRLASGRVSYVTSDFFKSFKENFKQGFIVEFILFDIAVILTWGTYLSFVSNAYFGKVIFVALDVFLASIASYVFPVLAKFQLSIGQIFRNSALMAAKYIPFTILNILLLFLLGYGVYNNIPFMLISLLITVALVAFVQAFWFNYIFGKYMPKEEKEIDEVYKEEAKLARQEKKQSYKKHKK